MREHNAIAQAMHKGILSAHSIPLATESQRSKAMQDAYGILFAECEVATYNMIDILTNAQYKRGMWQIHQVRFSIEGEIVDSARLPTYMIPPAPADNQQNYKLYSPNEYTAELTPQLTGLYVTMMMCSNVSCYLSGTITDKTPIVFRMVMQDKRRKAEVQNLIAENYAGLKRYLDTTDKATRFKFAKLLD